MKILINTPNYRKPESGGVANHYYGLKDHWSENIRYNIIGNRGGKTGSGKYWLIYDYIKFILLIIFWRPDLIVLNPSLAKNAIKRDALFLYLAKLFKIKTSIYFHGFNPTFANSIKADSFRRQFNAADFFIVLSSFAKNKLKLWGITKPIFLSKTKVDDNMLNNFDISTRKGQIKNILYLARVEKEKGIFIALDIFSLLSKYDNNLFFIVVGDGSALNDAKVYANKKGIPNLTFAGNLSGSDLIEAYVIADLYIFPSYHEGMPTTVLEAMAFGLPIISRPVGGLVDFFESEKMGFLIDSYEAKDFVESIMYCKSNLKVTARISKYNAKYASNNFLASKVAHELELLFISSLN